MEVEAKSIGLKTNMLTVESVFLPKDAVSTNIHEWFCWCRCECGNYCLRKLRSVQRGRVYSCGCVRSGSVTSRVHPVGHVSMSPGRTMASARIKVKDGYDGWMPLSRYLGEIAEGRPLRPSEMERAFIREDGSVDVAVVGTVDMKCQECGKIFQCTVYQSGRKSPRTGQRRRFCSHSCAAKGNVVIRIVNCDFCGKEYKQSPTRASAHRIRGLVHNFCSRHCSHEFKRMQNAIDSENVVVICCFCKKEFMRRKTINDRIVAAGFNSFCSQKCTHQFHHIEKKKNDHKKQNCSVGAQAT